MAYTTINKSTDYFNTKLYTGTGSSNAQTGVGFQPDFTWIKMRSNTAVHYLFNAVSGATKFINSDQNYGEQTNTESLKSFDTDGFTLGTMTGANGNTEDFASWNWKANGQGSSNTNGSINTTYTSANTTSGFSIITYTGNGTSGATIGHGLSTAPQMVIIKKLGTENWTVGHVGEGWTKNGKLNTNDSFGASALSFNNTAPTTSLITLGSGNVVNANTGTYVCYAFSNIQGFSKMGYYTGNGNANGTFVYTGFKPAFVILKESTNNQSWMLYDNKRLGYNDGEKYFIVNTNAAETINSDYHLDFLSNGIKLRGNTNDINRSGGTYIYMAFGQSIVGSNNVPNNAR